MYCIIDRNGRAHLIESPIETIETKAVRLKGRRTLLNAIGVEKFSSLYRYTESECVFIDLYNILESINANKETVTK